MLKTPVAGFNGIAGILWGEDFLMMNVKSNDGEQCVDTSHRLGRTATKETSTVDESKGKHYFTGLMIREKSEAVGIEPMPTNTLLIMILDRQ